MSVQLTFKIDKKGIVTMEVAGVQGMNCSDITKAFEENLGVVTDVQQKPEYYVELEGTKQYVGEE